MRTIGPHRLPELPDTFASTRDALHQIAFFAIAPRRYGHAERLGLRALPGGFGTPWFAGPAGRERVRMVADLLVVERGDEDLVTRPPTIQAACDAIGVPYREEWFADFHDPLEPGDPTSTLQVDAAAALALADWFAFGTAALEAVRDLPEAVDTSDVQLWPEHFDPATEAGDADAGARASFGASPGDAAHGQPYLYVAPWGEHDDDAGLGETFWNDGAFGGASMTYDELRATEDPLAAATAFLREGVTRLAG